VFSTRAAAICSQVNSKWRRPFLGAFLLVTMSAHDSSFFIGSCHGYRKAYASLTAA
jgi:hypothetical protein